MDCGAADEPESRLPLPDPLPSFSGQSPRPPWPPGPPRPSRLDAVRGGVRSFLGDGPDALLVGFQSYASGTRASLAPSTERGESARHSTHSGRRAAPPPATRSAQHFDALEGRRDKSGRRAPAAIVRLSDGATTDGADPIEAADRALGIPIHTVALGTADGVVTDERTGQSISVPPDPATLRAIAERSGAEALEVGDSDSLDEVYEQLGSRIGTRKERRQISSQVAGCALVLLLGALFGGVRWRARLP